MPEAHLGPYSQLERFGASAEYARRARRSGPHVIERYALRNRSVEARDVLAKAATEWRMPSAELVQSLRAAEWAGDTALLAGVAGKAKPKHLATLARLLVDQAVGSGDRADGLFLFEFVLSHWGHQPMSRDQRLIYAEHAATMTPENIEPLIERLGIGELSELQAHMLRANALRALHDEETPPAPQWLRTLGSIFGPSAQGLTFGSTASLDTIECDSAHPVVDGPLVSVLVPTYNPGPHILTALRGLIKQSWRNTEIIILDDASSDRQFVTAAADLDPRIRVLHLPVNGGTYRARNHAMAHHVNGEFVTVHDDDDWSVPTKIEQQVVDLINCPEKVANVSSLSRVTPDMIFARIGSDPMFVQDNQSSLMFRRRPVLEKIGFWDDVNRNADVEYRARIEAAFRTKVHSVSRHPLALLRIRKGSLTDGEVDRGYVDPRRLWYQQAARHWHRKELERGSAPSMRPSVAERAFPAPLGLRRAKNSDRPIKFDIVYATDFRFPGGNTSIALAELKVLADRYKVALLQLDSPLNGHKLPVSPKVLDLAEDCGLEMISLGDAVSARLVMIRHPSVLQLIPARRSRISAERAVVICNHAVIERNGRGSIYEPAAVLAKGRSIFGVTPRLAPESGLIREQLQHFVSPSDVIQFDWPGVVASSSPRLRQTGPRIPVIGRHGRDHPMKWPAGRGEIETIYPTDGSRDIRVLGGADVAQDRLGYSPKWRVFPFGTLAPEAFLDDLDFWVYFHHEELIESFGMATAEAMAQGVVPILPFYMEPVFGDGAVYCKPENTWAVIDSLWADPSRYRAKSKAALDYAAQYFAPSSVVRRTEAALGMALGSHQ